MIYTVLWLPSAEEQLAQLWQDADDRAAVADAADTVDAHLRRDPLTAGESRLGNSRVVFEGVLGIAFDVSVDDSKVSVKAVWRIQY